MNRTKRSEKLELFITFPKGQTEKPAPWLHFQLTKVDATGYPKFDKEDDPSLMEVVIQRGVPWQTVAHYLRKIARNVEDLGGRVPTVRHSEVVGDAMPGGALPTRVCLDMSEENGNMKPPGRTA